MKTIKNIFTFILISMAFNANTQEVISLNGAISRALEQNFDIQLANNDLLQAGFNKSLQNTGYLPTVTGSANGQYTDNDAFVETQEGEELDVTGIKTTSYGASLALNYNVYTGGNRKNQSERLKKAYDLSDMQRKIQIDNTILSIYTTYYNIARNNIQKNTLDQAFEISKQRLIWIEYQFQFGQKTNLDVLNAQVDANNDSLNLVNAQINIDNAKRELNFLMGEDAGRNFEVEETVVVNKLLDYDALRENMLSNNYQIKQIDLNKQMSEYDLKVNQSGWKPNLSTSVSYGFNNGNYGPTSLFAVQNSRGLTAGVNLNWNIYDGGATKVRVQNARIGIENQDLYKKQMALNLNTDLANTWADYQNQLVIMSAEEMNLKVNHQNFLKTEKQFKLGQVSSIEFRQAQLNLVQTQLNLTNAEFNAKIAEMKLKKLEGTLVEL